MDILHRIRDILSGSKTQKRKNSDCENFEINSSELKRRRSIAQNHVMTSFKHNYGMDTTARNYQNRNLEHDFDNETHQSITALIEGNNPQDFKEPMTNGKRKVPDLINVRPTTNNPIFNSMTNSPQQTIKPHFDRFGRGERNQFRNVPPLFSIKTSFPDRTNQSNYLNSTQKTLSSSSILANNSSLAQKSRYNSQQSKSILSNGYENGEESIFSQNPLSSTTNYRKNNKSPMASQAPQTDIGRANYQSLLSRIVPGYGYFAKSFKGSKNETNNVLETILDDDRESTASTSFKNKSTIEPVNSLKARFEVIPILKQNWETELNDKYSSLNLSRKDSKQAEENASKSAEIRSQHYEKSVQENNRKVSIASWQSYEIEEEEVPANDYPPFDAEKQKQIIRWISGRDTATVLISKFNLSITRSDIQTLNWSPLTWLNDEVINFYMELLGERSRQTEHLPKVHAMNTFFLPRLLEIGYSGVRRWTRKVDIFSFDVIPVPVHKGIHWCMAIIHLKNKTIKYYDSMGAANNQALTALTDYLKSECLDKKKTEFDLTGWTTENVRNIPQQENGSDCGVFSCMYAEFITRNRPIVFTQQHMQYFRMKMIFEICTGQMLN